MGLAGEQTMSIDNLFKVSRLDFLADELKAGLPEETYKRIDRAVDIVRGDESYTGQVYSVVQVKPNLWSVAGNKGSGYVVNTQDKTCTCPDFEKAYAGLCKHRLAVKLSIMLREIK
jgi:hypothetical protein